MDLKINLCLFFVSFATFVLIQPLPMIKPPPTKAIDFMRKFGYLEPAGGGAAETLYKEETIIEAIKTMQKFGGLNQTGVIDNETSALFTAPRCGRPDVSLNSNRSKRYVIGSDGWRKQHLTYFVGNWSPKLGDKENTESQLRRAFNLWSDYSNLRFTQVQSPDADIVIFFARGPHGDGYPLDGPGYVLAHAFYPYEHNSFGGDIHFDDEEDWVIGPDEGFDFFTVAAHEIGHSLGLAHSPVYNALMFPYYKGHDPNFQLDYDDILGVYQLYISNPIFTNQPDNKIDSEEEESEEDETDDENEANSEENVDNTDNDDDDDVYDRESSEESDHVNGPESDDDIDKSVEINPPNSDDDFETEDDNSVTEDDDFYEESTSLPLPTLCDGEYDTITNLRSELFVFKDQWVWRYRHRGVLEPGYPTFFQQIFQFPIKITKLDAVYERPHDNKIILITGKNYWIFDGDNLVTKKPLPLTNLNLPKDINKIDAALVWGKNDKTYFFSRDDYWRYNDSLSKMDDGYPQKITRWRGLPSKIDSAFQWTDGHTYFFVGKDYYRFNDQAVVVDKQYPLSALDYWFGCD